MGFLLAIVRNMFGGENNNAMLPGFLADNQFQFNSNALPQLQLFGDGEYLLMITNLLCV